jgi:mRNA interferase MazF
MTQKDFDGWNRLKKQLDARETEVYVNVREIWWCSFGLNIGTELYGKHELFERPVLVMKVYNRNTLKIVPLTSHGQVSKYYSLVILGTMESYASLTQSKTISTKRLSRKIGRIDVTQFKEILQKYKDSL